MAHLLVIVYDIEMMMMAVMVMMQRGQKSWDVEQQMGLQKVQRAPLDVVASIGCTLQCWMHSPLLDVLSGECEDIG